MVDAYSLSLTVSFVNLKAPISFNGISVVSPSRLFLDNNEPLIEPQDLNPREYLNDLGFILEDALWPYKIP